MSDPFPQQATPGPAPGLSFHTFDPFDPDATGFGPGLAIHTCSQSLGLATLDANGLNRSVVHHLGRNLATDLHGLLAEMIAPEAWRSLKFVAVATGPGGFTSTRLGLVTAQTIASQLAIPLLGFSTLAIAAWRASVPDHSPQDPKPQTPEPQDQEAPKTTETPNPSDDVSVTGSATGLTHESATKIYLVTLPARRDQVHVGRYAVDVDAIGRTTRLDRLEPERIVDRTELEHHRQSSGSIAPSPTPTSDSLTNQLANDLAHHQIIELGDDLGSDVSVLLDLALQVQQSRITTNCVSSWAIYGQAPVS